MNCIKTFIIILSVSVNCAVGQDFISIKGTSPYPSGTKVFFEGYDGFEKKDLGSIRTTANGELDYYTDYNGFCVMSAEGMDTLPLILYHDPTCLEWDSILSFPCEPENGFYYSLRAGMQSLDSLITRYSNSTDSLELILLHDSIDHAGNDLKNEIDAKKELLASVLLKGELLIMEARMIDNSQDLEKHKQEIKEYVRTNYDSIKHSALLAELAAAYTNMNRKVFRNPTSAEQATIYDVGDWLKLLGPFMEEKAIINFFLIHFSGTGNTEIVTILIGKYAEIVKCEQFVSSNMRPAHMPYTFSVFGGPDLSRVYSLDQFHGIRKILALYSVDCPASVASVVSLFGFMSEHQVRIPVILVPSSDEEGDLAEILKREAPFGMQTGMKTGSGIIIGAGIKQLPAFIILDERNLLKQVYYDFVELKADLSGD